MFVFSGLLLMIGLFTLVIPIRSLGLKRRYGAAMLLVGAIFAVASAPAPVSQARPVPQTSGFSSTSKCGTNALGEYRCTSEASFPGTTTTSKLVCKKNPITDQQECTHEMR